MPAKVGLKAYGNGRRRQGSKKRRKYHRNRVRKNQGK